MTVYPPHVRRNLLLLAVPDADPGGPTSESGRSICLAGAVSSHLRVDSEADALTRRNREVLIGGFYGPERAQVSGTGEGQRSLVGPKYNKLSGPVKESML